MSDEDPVRIRVSTSRLDVERGIRPLMARVVTLPVVVQPSTWHLVLYLAESQFMPALDLTDEKLKDVARAIGQAVTDALR